MTAVDFQVKKLEIYTGLPTADGNKSGHHRSRSKNFFKVFFADLEKTTSEVYIDSIVINIGNTLQI